MQSLHYVPPSNKEAVRGGMFVRSFTQNERPSSTTTLLDRKSSHVRGGKGATVWTAVIVRSYTEKGLHTYSNDALRRPQGIILKCRPLVTSLALRHLPHHSLLSEVGNRYELEIVYAVENQFESETADETGIGGKETGIETARESGIGKGTEGPGSHQKFPLSKTNAPQSLPVATFWLGIAHSDQTVLSCIPVGLTHNLLRMSGKSR